MDRIETMKAFVAVAEQGSFTKAADKLRLSSQLVSKYVSHLEQGLNVRLFNRTTRRVHLTEAGEQCLKHATQILESLTDMEDHFGQIQTQPKGRLHISAPVSFATLHLASLLRDFRKHYPDISINLELSDRKVDVVDDGFDVALRIGHLQSSSLIARNIAPIRLVLCAAPDYLKQHGTPMAPSELNPAHYLQYSYMGFSPSTNELINTLRTYAQQNQGAMIANNGEVLMQAAIAGEGYILQPSFIVGAALKQGHLQTLLDSFTPDPLGLYAVYPHRKLLAPKLRVFIDFLNAYYGESPYWDEY
ncbi:LysR family transcriptional regulator [Motilimonas eburnea]|uniref:LysR family transcriptional regulator n=1 Tax=Motilimonas eburnea TaxID=1737488 RepID=UPI001E491578|nr:LysR family transcriptional regulator [Motilimonas eburnea]MCE2572792.1 LysR family transcriptional regulator [Motilimonas eburnea]